MLRVFTWLWGSKYSAADVAKLYDGLTRNIDEYFTFTVVTDHPGKWRDPAQTALIPEPDLWMTDMKGCFARLRMFDPEWQMKLGVEHGDRCAWADLDAVVTGNMKPVFDRREPLVIVQGVNSSNPCPYNGSLVMVRAGCYPDVWRDFGPAKIKSIPAFEFPDDQGWLAMKVPGAAAWGPKDGVYAFQKPGWPKGDALPKDARFVCFPGWRSPDKFTHLPWVQEHWV
jgi:hypothetical protein